MRNIIKYRQKFTSLLGELSADRELGLRELARLAQLSPGLLSDIKAGRKCAGADISIRLANALKLEGAEREQFLLAAAGTRANDRLMKISQGVAPELVNHIPLALAAAGIHPASVDACTREDNALTLTLDDRSTVTCSTSVVHSADDSTTTG